MTTITYDPSEGNEGELTPDEIDSLRVGEELAQQQEQLLAGKYKDAAELESAYLELQRKFSERGESEQQPEAEVEAEPQQEDEEEVSPAVSLIQEASSEYYSNDGQLSPETIEKFSAMSSRELVEAYMKLQQGQTIEQGEGVPDLSQSDVNVIQNSVGGEQAYGQLVGWAAENLPADYINAFDDVVESGNMQAIQLAVKGLQSEYERVNGYEGNLLTGRAATQQADVFRSQAEVVRAMSDPRYDSDPAYRQDVFDKLERSSIDY